MCGLGRVLMLYWSCDRIKLIWDISKEKWFQGVATVMHRHYTSSKCKNALQNVIYLIQAASDIALSEN